MQPLFDILKLRDALINASREELMQYAKAYQSALTKSISEEWLTKLHFLVSGYVNKSTANYSRVGEIDKLMKAITAKQGTELLEWFTERMNKIGVLAKDHYNFVNPDEAYKNETLVNKSVGDLLTRIGFDGKTYASTGFLYDLIQSPDPVRKIKAFAFQAINRGLSFDEFKKSLTTYINGTNKTSGVFENYFRTAAYDSFQQADRQVNYEVAMKLKLQHALYAGTIMTTTRAFCLTKVNKYFHISEILAWATQTWQGKSTPYDPMMDCGGYNCIHILAWVSKKMYDENKPKGTQVFTIQATAGAPATQ